MTKAMGYNLFLSCLAILLVVVTGVENNRCVSRMNRALADMDTYIGRLDSLIGEVETNLKWPFDFENAWDRNNMDWDDLYEERVLESKHVRNRLYNLTMEMGMYLPTISIEQDLFSKELFLAEELNNGIRSDRNRLWINGEKIDMNYKNEYELHYAKELYIELKHYALNCCSNRVDTTVLVRHILPEEVGSTGQGLK